MIKDYANDISSIWFSYFFLSDRIELMLYDPPSLENSILGVTLAFGSYKHDLSINKTTSSPRVFKTNAFLQNKQPDLEYPQISENLKETITHLIIRPLVDNHAELRAADAE